MRGGKITIHISYNAQNRTQRMMPTWIGSECGFNQAKRTLWFGKWNFEINDFEKWCVDVGQPKDGINIVGVVFFLPFISFLFFW